MQIGLSTCHAHEADEHFLRWTAERIRHLDYTRFEVCLDCSSGKLGGVGDLIQYPVLERLNAHKSHDPARTQGLRRVFGELKGEGRQIVVWSHELAAPREILRLYPELATRRGDLNLTHPALTEWLGANYDEFFRVLPEVDGIVLTMTEVAFPVAHRFDCEWSPTECIRWLIGTIHESCRRNGKILIVRPFSAIAADCDATRRALAQLPNDIEIMVKSDPFDWDPFLPPNPELDSYPPGRLTVELDCASEYFGRGLLPVLYPSYLKERIDRVRSLGVTRVTGRIDRRGLSAMDTEGRINVEYFVNCASDPTLDGAACVRGRVAQQFETSDANELTRLLCEAFEVVKGTLYVDGHCLWHRLFGSLREAQQILAFEILRPNQPLDFCRDEWHILAERTSPDPQKVREEKDRAVELAETIRRRIAEIAPRETDLNTRAESMLHVARLYRAAVRAMQEYVPRVVEASADSAPFEVELRQLEQVAESLAEAAEPQVRQMSEQGRQFAGDLAAAFEAERRARAEKEDLPAELLDRLEDFVPAGHPGEGHRLSKFTHGSAAVREGDRVGRQVARHVRYTLRASLSPGKSPRKKLRFQARGEGRLSVLAGGQSILEYEWSRPDGWGVEEACFTCAAGTLEVRFDRCSDSVPAVGMIYLLAE